MDKQPCLGVIGGLGPMATAYFMELIIRMTQASCDQEHLEMAVFNCPSIPDRTSYLLGESPDSPLPQMLRLARTLSDLGAACIAIPCMTAHHFHETLQNEVDIPVLHGIRQTAAMLREAGVRQAGLMATDGTVRCRIFQQELENAGIATVLPSESAQKQVMDIIYGCVKAGIEPDMAKFYGVRDDLTRRGAEVTVLGCTELSIIKGKYPLGSGIADALEVLAKASLETCGKAVKAEFKSLITGV